MTQLTRLSGVFARCRDEKRAALLTFVTAGDPDFSTSLKILEGLPEAGADIVELGMPFSDPMADGPVIQLAGERALKAGHTMAKTFAMVEAFRARHPDVPLVLMGYYNPIYAYGRERFLEQCLASGVDALIVVDLPHEEDSALFDLSQARGLPLIRLVTPATGMERVGILMRDAMGFVYYVSVLGITGTKTPRIEEVCEHISAIRTQTPLPIVVGFGVKTQQQVAELGAFADGVVVGSSLVGTLAKTLQDTQATPQTAPATLAFVQTLSKKT